MHVQYSSNIYVHRDYCNNKHMYAYIVIATQIAMSTSYIYTITWAEVLCLMSNAIMICMQELQGSQA